MKKCLSQFNGKTVAQLRTLSSLVPAPVLHVSQDDVVFDVYLAKETQARWKNSVLQKLVYEARRTFLRYGDVPSEDAYDHKSWVYLARARYDGYEEWMSIRFVPAQGAPELTEDLLSLTLDGFSLDVPMKAKARREERHIDIQSISRLSAIRPYRIDRGHDVKHKQQYTAQCFALMNIAHMDRLTQLHHEGMVSMMCHPRLVSRLQLHPEHNNLFPRRAHAYLGLHETALRFNRSLLAYQYPTYFLDIEALLTLLASLQKEKHISQKTLSHYAHVDQSPLELIRLYKHDPMTCLQELRHLGNLISTDDMLVGGNLTGEDIRILIDTFVDEGPSVYMADVYDWRTYVHALVKDNTPTYQPLPHYEHIPAISSGYAWPQASAA